VANKKECNPLDLKERRNTTFQKRKGGLEQELVRGLRRRGRKSSIHFRVCSGGGGMNKESGD